MKLLGIEVVRVDNFKYLGSTIQSKRQYTRGEEESVGRVEWVEMGSGGFVTKG